jgi:SAM-dependent methyltransferase
MVKTKFHFVDDYRTLVRELTARYPLPEAMARAVGGSYDALGEVEKQMLIGYGLEPAHALIDVGCGSGRLAKALVPYLTTGRYLGTDVVQELLDYARQGCPPAWRFALVEDIRLPFPDNCADFACFYSVFTHLLHEESYCYLLEAQRVVKPGGRIVFSFLEYAYNWEVFQATHEAIRGGRSNPHLNTFIGRDAIEAWMCHLGMTIVDLRAANDRFVTLSRPIVYDNGGRAEDTASLGQSVCLVTNDKPGAESSRQNAGSAFGGYNITYRHG